jgi:type IV pilus assembly protein PilC
MDQSNQDPADSSDHAMETSEAPTSYRFTAQHARRTPVQANASATTFSGAIDATDTESAQATLAAMQLRVLSLEPVQSAGRAKPVRGGDFLAFNQQLATMTEAGLPMEHGLRLIARDLKGGKLSKTIQQVADELQAGKSLPDAFASNRGAFPPLYGAVLEAGVRSGNLPGVLMGLGKHLELMHRLRAAVWRALAYPLIVFLGVLLMLGVLGAWLVPQFREIFIDFDTQLPIITLVVLDIATYMPAIMIGLLIVSGLIFAAMTFVRVSGNDQVLFDKLLWIPLVGPVVRSNLLSRWCDALGLGLKAGLDLPGALKMSAQTLHCKTLSSDTSAMIQTIEQGQAITRNTNLRFVPAAVPASIELAAQADDLPGMLKNLSAMYQQQAEARVSALQLVLGPILLVFVAVIIGIVISALFAPMLLLMESLM